MKALLYQGPEHITYDTFDDPTPENLEGAVVKIESCAICGSDLHIYHGHGFSADKGFCVGHESVGEVVEVGSGVKRFKTGDKVLVSGAVGCSNCRMCLEGRVDLCENKSTRVFGLGHNLEGSQAQAVGVPSADTTLFKIPDGISTDQALLLTDNLPTGYYGAERANIKPGDCVAVVGLGPVGQLAVESAMVMGASKVWAIDRVPERLAAAEAIGAIPVMGDEAAATVFEATKGRGADAAIEAVGADETIKLAMSLVRTDGTVSVVGVNQTMDFSFPMAIAFVKSLTFRIGGCPVQSYWPKLVPLIQSGRLKPERVITHRMGLSDGAEAYAMFANRKDGVMKVVLDPDK